VHGERLEGDVIAGEAVARVAPCYETGRLVGQRHGSPSSWADHVAHVIVPDRPVDAAVEFEELLLGPLRWPANHLPPVRTWRNFSTVPPDAPGGRIRRDQVRMVCSI